MKFHRAFAVAAALLASAQGSPAQEFSCEQLTACTTKYGTFSAGTYPNCGCVIPDGCTPLTHQWFCRYFPRPAEFIDDIFCACDYVGPVTEDPPPPGLCEQFQCATPGATAKEDGLGGCMCSDEFAPT
jgi:hypothetical protein